MNKKYMVVLYTSPVLNRRDSFILRVLESAELEILRWEDKHNLIPGYDSGRFTLNGKNYFWRKWVLRIIFEEVWVQGGKSITTGFNTIQEAIEFKEVNYDSETDLIVPWIEPIDDGMYIRKGIK